MSTHFSCTMCGRCCHDLRIPLSLAEARVWLRDGGDVQLFCEALPWPVEPSADDAHAAYKRARSFAAMSGTLPVRIVAMVVAAFDGPCPNLLPDLRCGAYDHRPRVCRIYPAEVNPFVAFDPSAKGCPPEAWESRYPVFEIAGRYVNETVQADIALRRGSDVADVPGKRALCGELGVRMAALANEGFVIVNPGRDAMDAALAAAIAHVETSGQNAAQCTAQYTDEIDSGAWTVISNRHATRATLASVDAEAAPPDALMTSPTPQHYLGFHAASEA
ncbi:YkgJ family cysteine cluster protein [Paraburkholderia tropica]|uniref:YkgJ family cysteine cluster protein n=1 Tax=Paraburkholderia tropica TaxID=92647 RepID=UPI001CC6EAD1|nr:YkgJ family cysteine cluster protein [Paraburkholderia tropica]